MNSSQLPNNAPKEKKNEPAKQAVIFGVVGIIALLCNAMSIYAGGKVPFLILLTGPLLTLPLTIIMLGAGIWGMVNSIRAILSPTQSKVAAWFGAMLCSIILLASAVGAFKVTEAFVPSLGYLTADHFFDMSESPNGNIIAVAHNNDVLLLNVQSGERIKTLRGNVGGTNRVYFSPDGRFLADVSNSSQQVHVRDLENYKTVFSLRQQNDLAEDIFFSPDGQTLTIIWQKQGAMLINTNDFKTIKTFSFGLELLPTNSVYLSTSSHHFGKMDGDFKQVKIWNLADLIQNPDSAPLINIPLPHTNDSSPRFFEEEFDVSPDGSMLAIPTHNSSSSWQGGDAIQVWDIPSGEEVETVRIDPQQIYGIYGDGYPVFAYSFSPDGKVLAYVNKQHGITLIDMKTFQSTSLNTNANTSDFLPTHFIFVSGGTKLLATDELALQLWDAKTGAILWKYP